MPNIAPCAAATFPLRAQPALPVPPSPPGMPPVPPAPGPDLPPPGPLPGTPPQEPSAEDQGSTSGSQGAAWRGRRPVSLGSSSISIARL